MRNYSLPAGYIKPSSSRRSSGGCDILHLEAGCRPWSAKESSSRCQYCHRREKPTCMHCICPEDGSCSGCEGSPLCQQPRVEGRSHCHTCRGRRERKQQALKEQQKREKEKPARRSRRSRQAGSGTVRKVRGGEEVSLFALRSFFHRRLSIPHPLTSHPRWPRLLTPKKKKRTWTRLLRP